MLTRRGPAGQNIAATFGVARTGADGYPDKPARPLVAFPPERPAAWWIGLGAR